MIRKHYAVASLSLYLADLGDDFCFVYWLMWKI